MHYTNGILLEQYGKFTDAITELNESARFEEDPSRIYYVIAKIYLKKGNLPESIKYYEKARNTDFNWIYPKLTLSNLYYVTKQYSKALTECKTILNNIDKNNPDAIETIANIYEKEKKYNESIEHYKKVLSISGYSDKIYFQIAMLQSRLAQFDEAIINYKKCLELNPQHVSAHRYLATVYYIKKQLDLAEVECSEALKYNPLDSEAIKLLSNIYYNQKKLKESLSLLERYLFYNKKDAEMIYMKGIIQDEIGDTELAMKTIESSISLNKYLAGAYVYLAYISQKSGNNEKTISILEEAVKYTPDDVDVLKNLAVMYFENKQYKDALKIFLKLVDKIPNDRKDPIIYEHLGNTFFNLGMLEKAKNAWNDSILLDPTNEKLKKKLEEIK